MDLIDELIKQCGGSVVEAAKVADTTHQTINNWRKGGPRIQEFVEAMERVRKRLKLSKSQLWDRMIGGR